MTGGGRAGDIVVKMKQGPDGPVYEITGDDPSGYQIDEQTGKLMVYDHVFGRWDPLGERFRDEEQQA